MGLSFYYTGRLRQDASVSDLIEEVLDISKILNWEYHLFDTDLPEQGLVNGRVNGRLYGISFSPEGSEPVFLTFLSNRRLCSPVSLWEFKAPVDEVPDDAYLIFTKTQYAGPNAHMAIINVLRHIGKKYLAEINVTDEGHYWETRDEDLLRNTFNRYTNLIDSFSSSFSQIETKPGESIEDYILKVLDTLQKKGGQ